MTKLQLQVVLGKQRGEFLNFPVGEFVFGRGPECHVRPNSELVSRQHCLVVVTDESISLRDLGSINGTLVNGSRVCGRVELHDGDRIQVGPLAFLVHIPMESRAAETVADASIYEVGATMDELPLLPTAQAPIAETVAR